MYTLILNIKTIYFFIFNKQFKNWLLLITIIQINSVNDNDVKSPTICYIFKHIMNIYVQDYIKKLLYQVFNSIYSLIKSLISFNFYCRGCQSVIFFLWINAINDHIKNDLRFKIRKGINCQKYALNTRMQNFYQINIL